jgi:hypothetical protein
VSDALDDRHLELFELELLGGATERRYRQMRPEVEEMPWGTFDPSGFPEPVVIAARKAWTGAAFQEFRTGAACAATLQALIEARAPLDLIATASRFPLDELVHVELCSRLAGELGGGVPLAYDPTALIEDPGAGCDPLLRASHLVVAYFCVGEALSIPLLHGTWQAAKHPLVIAVLRRIVLDEADHGTFGWAFLDWANGHLDDEDRAALGVTADRFIAGVRTTWADLKSRNSGTTDQAHALGWLGCDDYLALAHRSLARQVIAPLTARGIPLTAPTEA